MVGGGAMGWGACAGPCQGWCAWGGVMGCGFRGLWVLGCWVVGKRGVSCKGCGCWVVGAYGGDTSAAQSPQQPRTCTMLALPSSTTFNQLLTPASAPTCLFPPPAPTRSPGRPAPANNPNCPYEPGRPPAACITCRGGGSRGSGGRGLGGTRSGAWPVPATAAGVGAAAVGIAAIEKVAVGTCGAPVVPARVRLAARGASHPEPASCTR